MQLIPVEGNTQKLDGGSMFGHAPKALWQRWADADEENRIQLACRALLVKHEGKNILLETGIGAFFEPKMKERYGMVEDHHVLLDNLSAAGLEHTDIDAVILSHLHFDHAGGLLSAWESGSDPELLFPNALIYTGKRQWERACHPHARDRASYIPQIISVLEDSGRLRLVEDEKDNPFPEIMDFLWSDGHTPGLMMTRLKTAQGPVLYASDMIPGSPWVHLPIVMAYDRFPEILVEEKEKILGDLLSEGGYLYFVHDYKIACGKVVKDEKGKYSIEETDTAIFSS